MPTPMCAVARVLGANMRLSDAAAAAAIVEIPEAPAAAAAGPAPVDEDD